MNDLPLRVALQRTLKGLISDLNDHKLNAQAVAHADVTSIDHLRWMANHSLSHLLEWPVDKISRWIGYIQGVMTASNIMDPIEERDRTRPFFHEAYTAMNISIPKTTERE